MKRETNVDDSAQQKRSAAIAHESEQAGTIIIIGCFQGLGVVYQAK